MSYSALPLRNPDDAENHRTMRSLLSNDSSVADEVMRKWEDRENDLVDVATIVEKKQESFLREAMSAISTCQVELTERNRFEVNEQARDEEEEVIEQARDEEEEMGLEVIEDEYLARELNIENEESFMRGVGGLDDTASVATITTMERLCTYYEQIRWDHQLIDLDDTVSLETMDSCRVESSLKEHSEFIEQATDEHDDDFSFASSKMNGVRETQPLGGPKYYIVSINTMGKARVVHEAMPMTDALQAAVAEEKGFEVIEYDFLTRKTMVENEGCYTCGMGGFESSPMTKQSTTPRKKQQLPIVEDGRSHINLASLSLKSSTPGDDHFITIDNGVKVERKMKFVPFRGPKCASDKKKVPAVLPPPANRPIHLHSLDSAKSQSNLTSLPLAPSKPTNIYVHSITDDNCLPLFSAPFRKSTIGIVENDILKRMQKISSREPEHTTRSFE